MTNIDYPDIVCTSANLVFRLTISSPENKPEERERAKDRMWSGFQSDFTYEMTHVSSGEVVWSKSAKELDDALDAPVNAWVDDSGFVVVITRESLMASLVVLDLNGDISLRCNVKQDLLEGSERDYRWTTVGPLWDYRGVGFFFSTSNRYWCFRTQHARQIVVNLDEGRVEKEFASGSKEIRNVFTNWALKILEKAMDETSLFEDDCSDDNDEVFLKRVSAADVWSAALWCGIDQVQEAAPFLKKLESSKNSSGYTRGWESPTGESTWLVGMYFVPVAQMSLRRLNIRPQGLASAWLCLGDEPTEGTRIEIPECIPDRDAKVMTLKEGMTRQQVTSTVGLADVESRESDYDVMDSPIGPLTLHITWDEQNRISQIEKRSPVGLNPKNAFCGYRPSQ